MGAAATPGPRGPALEVHARRPRAWLHLLPEDRDDFAEGGADAYAQAYLRIRSQPSPRRIELGREVARAEQRARRTALAALPDASERRRLRASHAATGWGRARGLFAWTDGAIRLQEAGGLEEADRRRLDALVVGALDAAEAAIAASVRASRGTGSRDEAEEARAREDAARLRLAEFVHERGGKPGRFADARGGRAAPVAVAVAGDAEPPIPPRFVAERLAATFAPAVVRAGVVGAPDELRAMIDAAIAGDEPDAVLASLDAPWSALLLQSLRVERHRAGERRVDLASWPLAAVVLDASSSAAGDALVRRLAGLERGRAEALEAGDEEGASDAAERMIAVCRAAWPARTEAALRSMDATLLPSLHRWLEVRAERHGLRRTASREMEPGTRARWWGAAEAMRRIGRRARAWSHDGAGPVPAGDAGPFLERRRALRAASFMLEMRRELAAWRTRGAP